MSVLDRAFIKAYKKDKTPPQETPNQREREESRHEEASAAEATVPAANPDVFCFGDTVHRVDACHPDQPPQTLQPHSEFTQPSGFADLAYVSPYHASLQPVSPEASEDTTTGAQSTDQESALAATQFADSAGSAAADPVTPPEEHDDGEIADSMVDDPAGSTEDSGIELRLHEAAQSLKDAASLAVPPTLELPCVFETPEDETGQDLPGADSEGFSPEWEVDRFTWPSICERLLETQSRYFSHVGQRLVDATAENHHVIMVSGSRRGEGRTTLALCLARCASEAGVRLALVDADTQNPELGSRLGLETPCSWLEAFAGTATLNETAVSSIEDQLTLFPLTGSEQVDVTPGDSRLISLLRQISAHFPLVIVDAGPVSSQSSHLFDGDEVCPVDTTIVVRDLRNTTENEAMATALSLQRSGIQAVGVAENFRAA